MQRSTLFLAALLLTTAIGPAAADPVADFYAGKQIKFIIRSGVGGSYDQYSRLLARHIGKHIPGNPSSPAAQHAGRRRHPLRQLRRQDRAAGRHHAHHGEPGSAGRSGAGTESELPGRFAGLRLDRQCQFVQPGPGHLAHLADQDARPVDDARDRDRLEPGRLDLGADAGSAQQHRRNQDQDRVRLSRTAATSISPWNAAKSKAAPPIRGRAISPPIRSTSSRS